MNSLLSKKSRSEWAFYALSSVIIAGIAVQNIFLAIAIVLLLPISFKIQFTSQKIFACFIFYLFLQSVVRYFLDPQIGYKTLVQAFTWIPLLLIPSIFIGEKLFDNARLMNTVEKLLCAGILIVSMVSISQCIWGWKLMGMGIVPSFRRASGFFSHPLTLAYVALIFWCCAQLAWFQTKLRWSQICFFVCSLVLIIASQSRVVQIIAVSVALIAPLLAANSRHRKFKRLGFVSLLVIVAGCMVVFLNPRFFEVLNFKDGAVVITDERWIFWEAHWKLFSQYPLFGLGSPVDSEVLREAYRSVGYKGDKFTYAAHNSFLQMAVEYGVVGLGLFLASIWFLFLDLGVKSGNKRFYIPILLSMLGLLIGSITQNAFQDSEVRFALMMVPVIVLSLNGR